MRGSPPNPTDIPQPQQEQLRINQFQVQVPRLLEMTNGSKDFNIKKKNVKRLQNKMRTFAQEPVLPGAFYLHRIEPGLFIHLSIDHNFPTWRVSFLGKVYNGYKK